MERARACWRLLAELHAARCCLQHGAATRDVPTARYLWTRAAALVCIGSGPVFLPHLPGTARNLFFSSSRVYIRGSRSLRGCGGDDDITFMSRYMGHGRVEPAEKLGHGQRTANVLGPPH